MAGDAGSFLLTGGSSRQQQAGRAFAAELLAPAAGIAAIVSDPLHVSDDELTYAADHFDVSELVIKHQVDNQLQPV
jgi:hypothetical protein